MKEQVQVLLVEGKPTAGYPGRVTRLQHRFGGAARSESQYAELLASRLGVMVLGGEPHQPDLVHQLIVSGRNREDVLGTLVARAMRSRIVVGQRPDATTFSRQALELTQRYLDEVPELQTAEFDFTRWYESRFGLHPLRDPDLGERGSPCGPGLASDIVHQLTVARNKHLMMLIRKALALEPKVGVVFGAGHYFALQQELAKELGQPALKRISP